MILVYNWCILRSILYDKQTFIAPPSLVALKLRYKDAVVVGGTQAQTSATLFRVWGRTRW